MPQDYTLLWQKYSTMPWAAIVTTGRAGTDFFQSLLDSHPEVFGFSGQFYFYEFWASSIAANRSGPIILEDIIDEFIGTHIRQLHSYYDTVERKDQLGEQQNQTVSIDTREFRQHLLGLLASQPIVEKKFLIAVYISYALCLGQDLTHKKLFLHHPHRIGRISLFMKDFPESKIICMIRDPRALYVSGVENWRHHDALADNPSYPLYIFQRAVDECLPLEEYNDGRLGILRLEDLAEKSTLQAVCDWLGITFDIAMTRSTWGGLRWWGDKISQNQISESERGFSKSMTDNKWPQKLSALDKSLINYLLVDILAWYGYPFRKRNGIAMAVLMAFGILLPTIFERRYLSPHYLLNALKKRNIHKFLAAFYHPARRIVWFYKLFYRRNFGTFVTFPIISAK